jgi:hypothetical protein
VLPNIHQVLLPQKKQKKPVVAKEWSSFKSFRMKSNKIKKKKKKKKKKN